MTVHSASDSRIYSLPPRSLADLRCSDCTDSPTLLATGTQVRQAASRPEPKLPDPPAQDTGDAI